jgi:SAM-dependent methyltransferase
MARGVIPISPAEGYQLGAETWDAMPSPIAALEERVLLPWIEPLRPRRAIDVGCGTGRWSVRFPAIGFDLSAAMLRMAARKPRLAGHLAVADATRLPVKSGSADLVVCSLVLGHIRNASAALREFARLLEPGGTLLLTDFHPDAVTAGWRHRIRIGPHVYEFEEHFYTLDELRSAVAGELVCDAAIDATIGEPERPLFERAGRPELFQAACSRPSVLLTRWRRK